MWAEEIALDHFAVVMERLAHQHSDNHDDANLDDGNDHGCDDGLDDGNDDELDDRLEMPDFLSTHPSVEDRVQMVEDYKAARGS